MGTIICLDPGHGPGCVNGAPDGSYKEFEFAWDMGRRVRAWLEGQGLDVILTKEEDGYPGLTKRAEVSNKAGAELFISLHSNAAGSGWSAPGGLLIYTSAAGETGRNRAAGAVLRRMEEAGIPIRGSGLLHEGYTVLTKTTAPAILIEYGFHTNSADVERLKDAAHRDKLALATARGVCDYLGAAWREAPPAEGLDTVVDRLCAAGIISSPGYWKAGVYSKQNVQALMRAMAKRV